MSRWSIPGGAVVGVLMVAPALAQPVQPKPLPSLPELAHGAAIDAAAWRWSAPLHWPDSPSQRAVRVVLPDSVWSRAASDLSDVRIVAGDPEPYQLAFVLLKEDKPRTWLKRDAIRPTPQPEHPGWSAITLPVEHANAPDVEVTVHASRCPFIRRVEIVTQPAPSNRAASHRRWGCKDGEPRPLRFTGLRPTGDRILLRFKDGDNAPMEPLTIEVKQQQRVVVLPGHVHKTTPRILVGNPQVSAPTYDLELARETLLRLPHQAVGVGVWSERAPKLEPEPTPESSWRDHIASPIIALAALAMCLLLWVTLRRIDPPDAET